MKMKYLVLGASRVGLRLLLAQSVLSASTAWAKPKILDRSVVAYWKFEADGTCSDSSGYGSVISGIPSGVTMTSNGSFDGTGYTTTDGTKMSARIGKDELDNAPTVDLNNSYHTLAAWCKTAKGLTVPSSMLASGSSALAKKLNDHEWHFMARRYQNNAGTSSNNNKFMMVCDPFDATGYVFWNDGDRPEVAYSTIHFPLTFSSGTFTIGGTIGVASRTETYSGSIDNLAVVNRMMTKWELTRLGKTGETYIYPYSDTAPAFDAATGWSSAQEGMSLSRNPGDFVGAAYILDGGKTMSYGVTGTFGKDLSNKISLTLGRQKALKNIRSGSTETLVSNTVGSFLQNNANTVITFYDLRLNDGTITASADGQSLTATLLDVEAPASKPFSVSVGSGLTYTFNAGGQVTGSGVLAKTGSGKLVLNNFTAATGENPKVRMTAGSIKTPRLDGYTGGTVIVDGDAVTFTGEDTLSGTIQVRYDGTIAAAEATYPVLNAPTLTSASQVAITAAIPEKYEGAPKLENGVVSLVVTKKVVPVPAEDKGTKPMLIWQ